MNWLTEKAYPNCRLPVGSTEKLLKAFSDFFVQKIEKIRQVILESIPPNQDLTYAPQHKLLSSLEILKIMYLLLSAKQE